MVAPQVKFRTSFGAVLRGNCALCLARYLEVETRLHKSKFPGWGRKVIIQVPMQTGTVASLHYILSSVTQFVRFRLNYSQLLGAN